MAVAICAALDHLTGRRPAPRRLDPHQPRRGSDCHPRANGHAGPLPSRIRRRRRHCSCAGGERRERSAAISTSSKGGWCCVTRESRGNPASITGKSLCGTSMATGAWRKTSKKSPRRATSSRGARTESMERTWPPDARGMGFPAPEPSHDFDSADRPHHLLRSEASQDRSGTLRSSPCEREVKKFNMGRLSRDARSLGNNRGLLFSFLPT